MSSPGGIHKSLSTIQAATTALTRSLTRLSTAQRINRASDDPAGLIASENLSARLAALDAESRTLQRQSLVIDTADGAMGQMADLLVRAEGLVVQSGGAFMSAEEKAAIQMEMDSIVNTIDRIAGNATFNGAPIFDGSMTFESGGSSITIDATDATTLGNVDVGGVTGSLADLRRGGAFALDGGDLEGAQSALDQARHDINTMRAETGAFSKYTVGARLNDLAVSVENIAAARSAIRDVDMASEIAALNRAEIMFQAGIAAANAQIKMGGTIVDLFG